MKREKWEEAVKSQECCVRNTKRETREKKSLKFLLTPLPFSALLAPYFINCFTGLKNVVGELVHTT